MTCPEHPYADHCTHTSNGRTVTTRHGRIVAPRYSPGAYRTDTRFPCPTCHRAGALSAYEQARRYQCADCTRRDEADY